MSNSFLSRRESLILTAVEVIDELGIQGLSTREVAKRQGMSNAVLFNHFKSKNDLLLAVLEYYTQFDASLANEVKEKNLRSQEALLYLVEGMATCYENYRSLTAISQVYDFLHYQPDLADKIKYVLSSRQQILMQVIQQGQEDGTLRQDVESRCIAEIIYGTFKLVSLNWRMSGYSFPLKERILYSVNAILDSFKTE